MLLHPFRPPRQPEARPAQQETAPATAEVRVDPDAEEKWVGAFYGRLKDSSAEIHYRQRRSEAERAVATHEITRATADQLLADVDKQEHPETGEAKAA